MVQRAARAGVTQPSAMFSPAEETEELGRDWVILKDCRLGRPARGGDWPTVLMHRARGVAVLDILPSDTPDAVEAVRARLEAARFPAIFAGHLPVVRLHVAPRQVPLLPSLLNDAFAEQPPLQLPGGDAWVGVAARALRAEQPVPRLGSQRRTGGEAAGVRAVRRPRRRGAALRRAAAVLLGLAALGGAVGFALNGAFAPAPAPEAAPTAAVPAPAPQASPTAAAPEAGTRQPPSPVLAPPADEPVPIPLPAPPARRGAAAPIEPVPERPPPVPPELPAIEVPPLPPLLRPVSPPALPTPAPSRRPETAAPPLPPAARRAPERPAAAERPAPERTAPPRQQGGAGTARPAGEGAAAAAPRMPENPPDRCRRVSASVGSGAPLAEADMRFFNENCIRW